MPTTAYFAYGSNMLRERLLARCPGATRVGLARLPAHCLNFDKASNDGSGKCAFEPCAGTDLLGVLWLIPDAELAALDRAEGAGRGYERQRIEVLMDDGGSREALCYRVTESKAGLVPYDWYHALVVAGAEQNALPQAYLTWLRGVRTQHDVDLQRRSRREALDALRKAGFTEVADALGD